MGRLSALAFLAFSILLMSVAEPVRVPRETQNIVIDVVDSEGKVHRLKGISCNGKGYLRVRKGSVEYSISLKSIKEIKVLEKGPNKVLLRVITLDGVSDNFNVSPSTICMSESKIGEANFYIKNVQSITFRHGEKK